MKDFIHSWKFKAIICLFALVFGFMIYAAIAGNNVIFPRSLLETISQPFVTAANAVSGWTERTLDSLINAERYREENEMLKEKLSEFYSQILEKEKTDSENEQLRSILGIAADNPDYEWSAPCGVTARNANDIYGGFTIDKGKADGIELYDPVFTSIGLVGAVTELSEHYSVVSTILSTDVKIGAVTAEERVVGIIENDALYSSDGCCLMSYIAKGSNISEGDLVITSGSSVFPEDLIIGTVERVISDANGLTMHAVIRPAEDVFKVTSVFVITDFKGQGAD